MLTHSTAYRCFFWLCCFCGGLMQGHAQEKWALQLVALDQEAKFWEADKYTWPKTVSDSLELQMALRSLLVQLQGESHLAASVDQIDWQDSTVIAQVYIGQSYEWAALTNNNVDDSFLEGIGYRERLYQKKPFKYPEVRLLQESLLSYAENNGYPFAAVWLDSLKIDGQQIQARLNMQKGPLIFMEGINPIGDVKISKFYLQNYLGLKPGDLYSRSKITQVKNRMKELPFLKEKKDATVTFRGAEATTNLFIEKRKASRWDFLIGVLPQNNTLNPDEITRPIITASILADMNNQLGLGEKVFFKFEQLRPQQQTIELQVLYPYLLDLPFGVDFDFNMYRRDTAFLDVVFDTGIQYLLEGGNYFKLFWKNSSSLLQVIDTNLIIQRGRLPDVLDVRNSLFGVEYQYQKLDYRFNPRKGWALQLLAGAGIKRIRENAQILNIVDARVNPQALYDSLTLQSFQYQLEGKLERFFPLFKNSTFRTALEGGMIFSKNPIYRNEQYRLGGNRLLRGFDEESINATAYSILTLEYRLLIGTNSNFYLFTNLGYLEDITVDIRRFDRPYGFGAGLTFETKVGLFGFSLALGSENNNPIDFRNVKTHFGYVRTF